MTFDLCQALGHVIGRRDIRDCKKVPLAWTTRYLVIAHRTNEATALKLNCLEKNSISLNENEQGASEYVQIEKDTMRARRYKGSVPIAVTPAT